MYLFVLIACTFPMASTLHRKSQPRHAAGEEEHRAGLRYGTPSAPSVQTVATCQTARTADADGVHIHGHSTSICQGSAAINCGTRVQGDARECEDIPFEGCGCI